MKKVYFCVLLSFLFVALNAQSSTTTYGRVYQMLNTKCTNASCHSVTSNGDGPKFDGDSNQVWNAIFNVPSQLWPGSVNKSEELVYPQTPYQSFLLRKITSGANFDTDLALDSTGEGNPMFDTSGNALSKIELEWVRQWIRYGAKESYFAGDTHNGPDAQPDYAAIYHYYTDSVMTPFLAKPAKPAAGTGYQFRMGPCFMAPWEANNQEFLEQQVVQFPYAPEIYELDGFMNQQSHHFILYIYEDSISAKSPADGAIDINDLGQVSPQTIDFNSPFAGNKYITGLWLYSHPVILPQGTAMMWDQKVWLDMDFHTLGYNITSVLPCDFYFNIYYRPRNPNTIPMLSHLVNNTNLGLSSKYPPLTEAIPGVSTGYHTYLYDDPDNSLPTPEVRYLWNTAGHTHKFGTTFYVERRDTSGALADTMYDGAYDYDNHVLLGFWDYKHPPLEYRNELTPVEFGMHNGHPSGVVANTTWYVYDTTFVTFSLTENGEMQFFYYMYTQTPLNGATAINDVSKPSIYFEVLPNPVDNNGKLVYTLPNAAKVEASIIDVTGKAVANLAQENEDTGVHEIDISNGRRLSAGLYFAKLVINGTVYTKKFIVTE